MAKAIDPFVNPNFGAEAGNPLVQGVKQFYFKNSENFYDDCVKDLDLRPGVREKYIYENAKRVILAPRNPPR